MRYQVGLLFNEPSYQKEVKQVVRATSANDAIVSLIKAMDLSRVYAAYAYPLKKKREGPVKSDWRWKIHCSISGKVCMSTRRT